MLTQTVAGRTYDFSHAVGGRYIGQPCSLAMGSGDLVYALLRGSELIGNVPWNQTGSGSRVARITIPTEPGAEEILGEFGKYGDGDGEFIWPTGLDIDGKENVYVTDEYSSRPRMARSKTCCSIWRSCFPTGGCCARRTRLVRRPVQTCASSSWAPRARWGS